MTTERDLDKLLTTEMTKPEWLDFGQQWRKSWMESLIQETGISKGIARIQARYDWERYVGQEGYTGRDEEIAIKRDLL